MGHKFQKVKKEQLGQVGRTGTAVRNRIQISTQDLSTPNPEPAPQRVTNWCFSAIQKG